jgi:hypothetical protein
MLALNPSSAAILSEHLDLMKIGEVLQKQFNIVAGPMPEPLAGLLAQLEQNERTTVLALCERCLHPFDLLDNMIRRSVLAGHRRMETMTARNGSGFVRISGCLGQLAPR